MNLRILKPEDTGSEDTVISSVVGLLVIIILIIIFMTFIYKKQYFRFPFLCIKHNEDSNCPENVIIISLTLIQNQRVLFDFHVVLMKDKSFILTPLNYTLRSFTSQTRCWFKTLVYIEFLWNNRILTWL